VEEEVIQGGARIKRTLGYKGGEERGDGGEGQQAGVAVADVAVRRNGDEKFANVAAAHTTVLAAFCVCVCVRARAGRRRRQRAPWCCQGEVLVAGCRWASVPHRGASAPSKHESVVSSESTKRDDGEIWWLSMFSEAFVIISPMGQTFALRGPFAYRALRVDGNRFGHAFGPALCLQQGERTGLGVCRLGCQNPLEAHYVERTHVLLGCVGRTYQKNRQREPGEENKALNA